MKVLYGSSSVSETNSTYSDEFQPYTITDLNEVTRQFLLYKEKLRAERNIDLKAALQLSYSEDDSSFVFDVPTDLLLPESSVNTLQMYERHGAKGVSRS